MSLACLVFQTGEGVQPRENLRPAILSHCVLCAGMAVCPCVRICVGAHMLTRTRARKKARFFLPASGLVEAQFLAFEKFTKKKKQKERT